MFFTGFLGKKGMLVSNQCLARTLGSLLDGAEGCSLAQREH